MNLEQQREVLRKSYCGTDAIDDFLYEDYKLLIRNGALDKITDDHYQAVIYKNRKVCLPEEGLF